MSEPADKEIIRAQAGKILSSGVLGRSRFYVALLEFLLDCSRRDHTPKEVEIAAEVFNRGDEFDPSQDSMVRVYAHNLRQKLQQYYAAEGAAETQQITIPKGEYRLTLASPATGAAAGADSGRAGSIPRTRFGLAVIVAASIVAGVVIGRVSGTDAVPASASAAVAGSALWAPVTDDDLPITLVVGDFYIFGELDDYGNIGSMRREFDINSSRDLDEHFMLEPEDAERWIDLDLTYLPTSMAPAIRDLMLVLATTGKPIHVVAISDLDTSVVRDSHIVYLGYLSTLGMLHDFVFTDSALAMGETPDELVNLQTGETFISEAGLPSGQSSYRDYGLFSTLPGPGGNQFVFVTGTRDEGLMQTAQAVSDPELVPASVEAVTGPDGTVPAGFELLYEVAGLDRTNLNARIVHSAPRSDVRVGGGHRDP